MKTLSRWLLLIAACAGAVDSVWAQPGGGGRSFGGGRGPGGGGGGFRAMTLMEPDSFLGAYLGGSSRFFREHPAIPVIDKLALSDEQKEQLQKIRDEMGPAVEALGMDASDDDIKAKLKELDKRALDVLNSSQMDDWDDSKADLATKTTEMRAQFQQRGPGGFNRGGPRPEGGGPPVGGPPGGGFGPRPPRSDNSVIVPEGAAVVSSFNTGGPAPRGGDGVRLSFNFRYAPWTEVLKEFAEKAGLTLDLNVVPPGTFSYLDNQEYTVTEALDVLNGYLLQRGYVLVRRDRFLTPINIDEPIPPNVIPVVTIDELPERGKNELISVAIPLESVEVDKVVGEVRELLGPQGKASALKNTNSLFITDIGANVHRVYGLLKSGISIDNRENAFKSIPLKHISALEAERMVRRLFGLNQLTSSTSTTSSGGDPRFGGFGGDPRFGGFGGFGGDPRFGGFSRDGGRDGRDSRSEPQSSSRSSTTQSPYLGKIQVTADTRTNHLLVTASAVHVKLVEEAVKELDTDTDANGNKLSRTENPLVMKVYDVAGADASQVARTLSLILPGLAIVDDSRTAKLHVQGTDEEHREVEKLIKDLAGEGPSSIAVINLIRLDPVGAANTLKNLFINEGSRAPSIEADAQGRRIMVRGTPDQVNQVKAILTQLGEPGDGAAVANTNRGPIRTLPLNGKDPQELLPLLRQVWTASGQPPIRIVVPSKPSVIQDRKVPSKEGNPLRSEVPTLDRGAATPPPRDADERRTQFRRSTTTARPASFQRFVSEETSAEETTGEETAIEPTTPPVKEPQSVIPGADVVDDFLKSFLTAPTEKSPAKLPGDDTMPAEAEVKSASPGISAQIINGELVIVSEDQKALDEFEALYESIAASIPARTRWTVFYLRTADATETAQMLERLFPQSTVTTSTQQQDGLLGSFASGFSSLGRGVMNVTGLNNTLGQQSLRIVTDVRANALFVTGPSEKIDEIEQMLQLLDASELPESLRDRLPRSIPVEYADVNEVADVVESVFKESMQAEQPMPGGQQGGRGGFNPLAMMMAGAQGGGAKGRGPDLTLGVDARTSHIIVSCNESLFRQIEELVQTIDQRAKDARQTVRVVPLATADPAVVTGTLSSLFTKVSVSGTRSSTRTSRSTTTGGSSNNNSNGGGGVPPVMNDPEVFRRMMEARDRGGDRGGSPFGGGGSPFGGDRGGGPFGRGSR